MLKNLGAPNFCAGAPKKKVLSPALGGDNVAANEGVHFTTTSHVNRNLKTKRCLYEREN